MFKVVSKVILATILWGVFIYVILQVPYPDNITQANTTQLISFFLPLFLAISFTINIFVGNIFVSTSIALGLIFLLILKALNSLNIVTAVITLAAVGLLVSYFKKIKRRNLTNWKKIPRLTHLRRKK